MTNYDPEQSPKLSFWQELDDMMFEDMPLIWKWFMIGSNLLMWGTLFYFLIQVRDSILP